MSKTPPVLGKANPAFTLQAPGFAAQLARIEVDPDTGEITLPDFVVRAGRRQGASTRWAPRARSRAAPCRASASR